MNRTEVVAPTAGATALSRAYPVAEALFRARGLGSICSQPAVLVYQMAKVGSKTVLHTVRRSRPGVPVFHVHALTRDGMQSLERFYRWSRVPALPGAGHLLVSRFLEGQMQRGLTPGRWKVITLVRDPIARNMSLLFHLGKRLLPDFAQRCDAGTLDPVAIFDRFSAAFPGQVDCMRWFDDELRRVFGVDVFETPFDREAGYQVYPGPLADVLVIKTEALDRVGEDALRSFLGLAQVRWKRTNIRARKMHGERYTHLLRTIALDQEYVERCYGTTAVRHFYSPAELKQMRFKWCVRDAGAI